MKINIYKKKNGDLMIFANGSNGVSVGIGREVYTSKFTNGQKNTFNEFFTALKEVNSVDFTGSYEKHTEQKEKLDLDLELYITDVCCVGGQKVESDGGYLVYKNKLISINEF